MARILGLDYGEKRLGFARSDETEMLATPLCVETVHNTTEALAAVERVCAEQNAAMLVVGMPISMDGSHGPAAQRVTAFVQQVRARLSIPVAAWDERLSTAQATSVLLEADVSRKRRREVVDKLAAQLILQSFLDARAVGRDDEFLDA